MKRTTSQNLSGRSAKETPLREMSGSETLDAIFDSIGDGVIATDEFGRITRINPVALKVLGYTESELLGSWFPKIIQALSMDNEVLNLIDRPITRAFLTGKPISDKIYYRRKDGHRIPVYVNVSPILRGNRPIGAVEVFRDITIEQEVDLMKSEFISLASHQLRTPLSAIKTYTHMLYDGFMGDLNDPQKKSLGTIIGASDRMNELISTLLNVTRIESGTIAVTPKLLKLDKLTDEVINELSLMAENKLIDLNMKVKGTGSLSIKTDGLIVKEILSNLISNAIKYTPEEGEVAVTIKPRRPDILIEVRDSGWGIPKISQEQVFSKFFRGKNVVKRETTGTGLGLYLVKGLLETLGGTIWFESVEGESTTFYFTLPRARRIPHAQKLPLTDEL
jgi:PAS domain S-box-containing protein